MWRDVVSAAGPDRSVVALAGNFNAAAKASQDPDTKAVLETLAVASSAMLKPDDWNEPFTPAVSWRNGSRSALPSDLDGPGCALLLQIAKAMDTSDDAGLRARVYDVCWTYLDRRDQQMWIDAIDAYTAAPLDPESWHGDGAAGWQRAFELVRRRGAAGREQAEAMAATVRDRVRRSTVGEAFFGVQLSEFARRYKLVEKQEQHGFAEMAVQVAQQAREARERRLAQSWEEEAAAWYSASGDQDAASHATLRLARDFVAEAADRRQGVGGAAITASHFVECALAILRKLPRKFRAANGVDDLIKDLRPQLEADREALLDSMVAVSGGSFDLSGYIEQSRRSASGHDRVGALIALAALAPLEDPDRVESTVREQIQQAPLSVLFGGETLRASGQKVAATPGMTVDGEAVREGKIDPAVWAAMVRNHLVLVDVRVVGLIAPALRVVTAEHRYSSQLLYRICYESPSTPAGREGVWALGFQRGLDGDFVSAASLLVPQIEHWVRVRLKEHGGNTLITDEHGVESEKGLGSLLNDSLAVAALGAPLVFELRALMTEQLGPNLRNDIAHGLIEDSAFNSSAAVYAWWIGLKLIMLPLAFATQSRWAENDGGTPGGSQRTGDASS